MTASEDIFNGRDLRSADREFKRDRDLASKWMYGSRPLGDKSAFAAAGEEYFPKLHEDTPALLRPSKKMSQCSHATKKNCNTNKRGANGQLPPSRIRATGHVREEIQEATLARSLVDLLPSTQLHRATYGPLTLHDSISRAEVPVVPLPLSVFVKSTGRETEKLVEKEYEVLDDNGQLLKGRKARYNLRHGNSQSFKEDEGFELL